MYKALKYICSATLVILFSVLTAEVSQAAAAKLVVLQEQEVRAAVERFVADKVDGRGWETSISRLYMPQGVKIPSGKRDLEILAPSGWAGWGAVNVALVVRVNGVTEKNLPLRIQVEARTEMVTASRQLLAGTILTAEDLNLQKQELAQSGGFPVKNIADIVGKKTRSTIRAGAPVRSDQLVSLPVVVSGQMVTIVAENDGIKITVSGRARSSGGIGDLVKVQNLLSQKEISARIVDSSTVEVGF